MTEHLIGVIVEYKQMKNCSQIPIHRIFDEFKEDLPFIPSFHIAYGIKRTILVINDFEGGEAKKKGEFCSLILKKTLSILSEVFDKNWIRTYILEDINLVRNSM